VKYTTLTRIPSFRGGEPVEDLLLRFLKARGGDHAKAFAMIKEDLEWREKNSIHLVRTFTSRQMLSADEHPAMKQKHDEIFRHGFLGYDKQNRPVIYKWYNKNYLIPLGEDLDAEMLARYNTWMVERLSGDDLVLPSPMDRNSSPLDSAHE
jgi:hypothetical protein